MSPTYIFTGIAIMALTTYVIRMIPMVFFSKPIHNRFFQSFLYYVPYTVLSAMTFPAVFSSDLPIMVCGIGVLAALVSAWRGDSLLKVAAVSALSAWLASMISFLR